jgi:hypothetical protein
MQGISLSLLFLLVVVKLKVSIEAQIIDPLLTNIKCFILVSTCGQSLYPLLQTTHKYL